METRWRINIGPSWQPRKMPEVGSVPLVKDYVTNEDDRRVSRHLISTVLARPISRPQYFPRDRVRRSVTPSWHMAVRSSWGKRNNSSFPSTEPGEDMERIVREGLCVPEGVVDKVRKALADDCTEEEGILAARYAENMYSLRRRCGAEKTEISPGGAATVFPTGTHCY